MAAFVSDVFYLRNMPKGPAGISPVTGSPALSSLSSCYSLWRGNASVRKSAHILAATQPRLPKQFFISSSTSPRAGALRCLLPAFNRKLKMNLFNGKYQLIACDGSALDIFRNPDDPDTFFPPCGMSPKGYNRTYINACYSILDRRFTGIVIQLGRKRTF